MQGGGRKGEEVGMAEMMVVQATFMGRSTEGLICI